MMKNIAKMVVVALMAVAVVGCSRSTVEPATKGKVISGAGYSPDIKQPGRYWLTWTEDMITLDTSTRNKVQGVAVRMADKLELGVGVSFRGRLRDDDAILNAMFNDIKVKDNYISFDEIYVIYGRDVMERTVRDVLNKYTNEQFLEAQAAISQEVSQALTLAMKNSPIEVSNVTLGGVKLPDEITKAINKQAERDLAIKTEANEQAVRMVVKENEMKLATADQAIRVKQAETIRKENEITSSGLSSALIEYRRIEAAEKIAQMQAENKNATFVPYEALGSSGLSNRVFNK